MLHAHSNANGATTGEGEGTFASAFFLVELMPGKIERRAAREQDGMVSGCGARVRAVFLVLTSHQSLDRRGVVGPLRRALRLLICIVLGVCVIGLYGGRWRYRRDQCGGG